MHQLLNMVMFQCHVNFQGANQLTHTVVFFGRTNPHFGRTNHPAKKKHQQTNQTSSQNKIYQQQQQQQQQQTLLWLALSRE